MRSKPLKVCMLSRNAQVKEFLESCGHFSCHYYDDEFDVENAQVMYFDGGEDVTPSFYHERNVYAGMTSIKRDTFEFAQFLRTRNTHYHLGFCRGSQLLWVANGGKLWQDITGHAISGVHGLTTASGKRIEGVTSTHHQAARQVPYMKNRVIATERYEAEVAARAEGIDTMIWDVVEAHWHPDTMSLGIQGHPEYAGASVAYENYVFDLLLFNEQTKITA